MAWLNGKRIFFSPKIDINIDEEAFDLGREKGKLELVQNTESLQTTAVGTSLVLDGVSQIEPTLKIKVAPKNYFDIMRVGTRDNKAYGFVENRCDGTLYVEIPSGHSGGAFCGMTLGQIAPDLKVGETYVMTMDSINPDTGLDSTAKMIHLTQSGFSWVTGWTRTITETDLNSQVNVYASGANSKAIISSIKIEKKSLADKLPTVTINVSDNENFENATQYTSRSDNTFEDIYARFPITYISTETGDDGVVIECEYTQDIDAMHKVSRELGEKRERYIKWTNLLGRCGGSFQFAFAGMGWTEATFKPIADIVLGNAYNGQYMFSYSAIKNIKQCLLDAKVKLDTSKTRYMAFAFESASTTALPKIDLSGADGGTQSCFACKSLVTIDEVVFSEKTATTNTFSNAEKLTHVIFSGILVKSLDLHWSTLLDKESIVSAFSILSTTTSGLTLTLSKVAVDKAFETSTGANDGSTSTEWATLVGTKTNWTISLV